jgi:hypothetical protein
MTARGLRSAPAGADVMESRRVALLRVVRACGARSGQTSLHALRPGPELRGVTCRSGFFDRPASAHVASATGNTGNPKPRSALARPGQPATKSLVGERTNRPQGDSRAPEGHGRIGMGLWIIG